MLFNSDFNILIIATKQEVAKNLVTKVRYMNDNLPTWLKQTAIEDNKLSLRYSNGSQIKVYIGFGDVGRSETLSLLVFDEALLLTRLKIYGYHHNQHYQLVVVQLYFLLQMVLVIFFIRHG